MELCCRCNRWGDGGNFFHTLGSSSKTFFIGSFFVFTAFIGFVTAISSASMMHPPTVSALNQCSQSYEISEILKNIFATFFHRLPIPVFVLPFVCFHLEPNRLTVFIEASNNNLHRHRGGWVLVSIPAIPFFHEQFLEYARFIFAPIHARDSFKRCAVHQPFEAAVDDDIANRNLVFALAPFDARFV